MNTEKLKHATVAAQKDAAARAAEAFFIFVAGPYICIDQPADHPKNCETPAKKLRYFLCHAFKDKGVDVYLGEDVILRENGEKQYNEHNNPVLFERHYIKNHLDGTILLPSSPGSFCEAGDWISDEDICKRLLVIVDKPYEGKTNYINDGVVKFAEFNGAEIKYLDYSDHDSVKSECESFIRKIIAKKRASKLYGRA